eukprot:scaffold28858_cov71-Cyclotella_meneghiniana.AAC.4
MAELSASTWKVISMVVFTVLSIIGFAIPVILENRANQLYVTSGTMFSAGVLLAAGFVHLLVDSNETVSEVCGEECFPWSFAVAGIIMNTYGGKNTAETSDGVGNVGEKNEPQQDSRPARASVEYDADASMMTMSRVGSAFSVIPNQDGLADGHHHHTHDGHLDWLTSAILTFALDIHVILEGLGIGATNDVSEIESQFVAVAFHKFFTAYALSTQLVEDGLWSNPQKRVYYFISTGLFIGLNFLGIGIGWAISSENDSDSDTLGTAIIIAMCAGSFVYVSAIEIIPEQMEIIRSRRLSTPLIIFCFLLGYCLMTLLGKWV